MVAEVITYLALALSITTFLYAVISLACIIGTTEQAIRLFQEAGFVQSVENAMYGCAERSEQLAQEFD